MVRVMRLSPTASLPIYHSAQAAGMDLCADEDVILPPGGGRVLINTGIAIALPEGTYGRIAPRSGLAFKHGIDVGGGVIDADYRGAVKVLLFNHDPKIPVVVKVGDRIAQLIVEVIRSNVPIVEVDALNTTERGDGGFGSTGM